jgi:putative transposase
VMEHASRRLIHLNTTLHPTAAWTLQQLREALPSDHGFRIIIHDHDAIFSAELNASLTHLGLKVIITPVRSPQSNSLCERLIGTLWRECLDWIVPLSETTPEKRPDGVEEPLQSRQTTFLPGAGHSRSEAERPPG